MRYRETEEGRENRNDLSNPFFVLLFSARFFWVFFFYTKPRSQIAPVSGFCRSFPRPGKNRQKSRVYGPPKEARSPFEPIPNARHPLACPLTAKICGPEARTWQRGPVKGGSFVSLSTWKGTGRWFFDVFAQRVLFLRGKFSWLKPQTKRKRWAKRFFPAGRQNSSWRNGRRKLLGSPPWVTPLEPGLKSRRPDPTRSKKCGWPPPLQVWPRTAEKGPCPRMQKSKFRFLAPLPLPERTAPSTSPFQVCTPVLNRKKAQPQGFRPIFPRLGRTI